MRYIMEDKTKVEVMFDHHFKSESRMSKNGEIKMFTVPYKTTCIIKLCLNDKNLSYTAESLCAPCDNFCRLAGRKIAFNKILKLLQEHLSKQQRAELFYLVFPQYSNVKPEVTKSTLDNIKPKIRKHKVKFHKMHTQPSLWQSIKDKIASYI